MAGSRAVLWWVNRLALALGLLLVALAGVLGVSYTVVSRKFVSGDGAVLDGIVRTPVAEILVLRNAALWDGRAPGPRPGATVVVRDGRISAILDAAAQPPQEARVIEAAGKTLLPGFIDSHVHLMYDSGPDLLTRAPKLMREWMSVIRRYPEGREPIVRRAQLKLKAGVTTMRILGDGYYSLAFREDLARWDIVGPRVLTAGLHVDGPGGYVSGGLGAHLDPEDRAAASLELRSLEEIGTRLRSHIDRGIDLVKVAVGSTTPGRTCPRRGCVRSSAWRTSAGSKSRPTPMETRVTGPPSAAGSTVSSTW